MIAFASAPIVTPLSHRSNPTPRLQCWGQLHWSRGRLRSRRHPQGDADHHPEVSHRSRVFAFASAPGDTHLPSYSAHGTHPSQYRKQLHRIRGRLRARCRPQGDADHQSQVRRRTLVFAFVSEPADKLALLLYPLCSSFTVLGTTASPTRPSRRSKTPRAAVSASTSSKRPLSRHRTVGGTTQLPN